MAKGQEAAAAPKAVPTMPEPQGFEVDPQEVISNLAVANANQSIQIAKLEAVIKALTTELEALVKERQGG